MASKNGKPTKPAKPKRARKPTAAVTFHEPSAHERIDYHVEDMAKTLTFQHPRVKAIHESIKDKLHKVADKTMNGGTRAKAPGSGSRTGKKKRGGKRRVQSPAE